MVWMLEELIHKIPSSADVCIMYDIACTLVQHLKGKRAAHLLERFLHYLHSMLMATMLPARYV